jgi:hypothetical protein
VGNPQGYPYIHIPEGVSKGGDLLTLINADNYISKKKNVVNLLAG